MMRKYSLVMEIGPDGFSGYVLEVPTILVTGSSADELVRRATEAIRIYREASSAKRASELEMGEIEVELAVKRFDA